jgi:3'(2'), 5'-bisphosphate nucleotidase
MNSLKLANTITQIARTAGDLIMTYYDGEIDIELKADASPVTVADRVANQLIVEALTRLTPHIPIIAEESVTGDEKPEDLSEFWLVDPLDGTKEFIKKNGDFTVNIALIRAGTPVLGVVHPPVHGTAYIATGEKQALLEDRQGHRQVISARVMQLEHPTVVVSRSHRSLETEAFLDRFPSFNDVACGSSLKFCVIASGGADLYPRLGRTMEWDTAAGHAVLNAAGGRVETLGGQPLVYGKRGLDNPHFIAWGRDN